MLILSHLQWQTTRQAQTVTTPAVRVAPPWLVLPAYAALFVNTAWVSWFLSTKGNEYFCEIDEEYILDRFNLTGLNAEVNHYAQAMDLITDSLGKQHIDDKAWLHCADCCCLVDAEEELPDELREAVETSARHLYGLIHARFIITSRGLSKMVRAPLYLVKLSLSSSL